jgi:hypothetical protein
LADGYIQYIKQGAAKKKPFIAREARQNEREMLDGILQRRKITKCVWCPTMKKK